MIVQNAFLQSQPVIQAEICWKTDLHLNACNCTSLRSSCLQSSHKMPENITTAWQLPLQYNGYLFQDPFWNEKDWHWIVAQCHNELAEVTFSLTPSWRLSSPDKVIAVFL